MRIDLLLALAAVLTPLSCFAKINVVTTAADFAAIAQAVGGDTVSVVSLARGEDDLHHIDARPSYLVPLSRADLLLVNGMELEDAWLDPLINNARNPKIMRGGGGFLNCSTAVKTRLEIPASVSRAQGDIHPSGNPHYSNDPRNALRVAQLVAKQLTAIAPDKQATIAANLQAFESALTQFAQAEAARFRALPAAKRRFVSYHRNWSYFAQWLGLEVVQTLEAKPGVPPSPAHLLKVIKTMRATGAKTILMASYHPRTAAKRVAAMAKASLVPVTFWTRFEDGESYLDHMRSQTTALYDALSK